VFLEAGRTPSLRSRGKTNTCEPVRPRHRHRFRGRLASPSWSLLPACRTPRTEASPPSALCPCPAFTQTLLAARNWRLSLPLQRRGSPAPRGQSAEPPRRPSTTHGSGGARQSAGSSHIVSAGSSGHVAVRLVTGRQLAYSPRLAKPRVRGRARTAARQARAAHEAEGSARRRARPSRSGPAGQVLG
jgi:hypothetical protein